MENQNKQISFDLELIMVSIILFVIISVSAFWAIYYNIAPTILYFFPKIEQMAQSENKALLVATLYTWIGIGFLCLICIFIFKRPRPAKPIPNDNILDAPDEL
jgi:hypothetical protein